MYENCAIALRIWLAENALSEQKEGILKDGEHNPEAQDDCTLSLDQRFVVDVSNFEYFYEQGCQEDPVKNEEGDYAYQFEVRKAILVK